MSSVRKGRNFDFIRYMRGGVSFVLWDRMTHTMKLRGGGGAAAVTIALRLVLPALT